MRKVRITDDCELVQICELGLGVEPGSQVAGEQVSKKSQAAVATANWGANAEESDRLRIASTITAPNRLIAALSPKNQFEVKLGGAVWGGS